MEAAELLHDSEEIESNNGARRNSVNSARDKVRVGAGIFKSWTGCDLADGAKINSKGCGSDASEGEGCENAGGADIAMHVF